MKIEKRRQTLSRSAVAPKLYRYFLWSYQLLTMQPYKRPAQSITLKEVKLI